MGTKVTISSVPRDRISINNQQQKSVKTIGVNASDYNYFALLKDVDATDSQDNYTVVFDEVTGKYTVKPLPVIDGGIY